MRIAYEGESNSFFTCLKRKIECLYSFRVYSEIRFVLYYSSGTSFNRFLLSKKLGKNDKTT